MRPRPDAAENRADAVDPESVLRASMRPRPDAAENFFGGFGKDGGIMLQ